jgi:uncharacterized protein YuzE
MDICFELDNDRDVARIRLNTHHPLKRVWRTMPARADCQLEFDRHGELVALEVLHARKRLTQWGIRLP